MTSLLIIVAASASLLGTLALAVFLFSHIATYLVEKRNVRPSRVDATFTIVGVAIVFTVYWLVPMSKSQFGEAIMSHWGLVLVAVTLSVYLSRSISLLRHPPSIERRRIWYRASALPEWTAKIDDKPPGRFRLSTLVIWFTLCCLLLGIGQIRIRERTQQHRRADERRQAAIERVQQLGGVVRAHEVTLAGTEVRDADLKVIVGLDDVAVLNLGATEISNEGVRHLAALQHLRELTLSGTNIDDDALSYLVQLRALETLLLRKTKVTGLGFAPFSKIVPHRFSSIDLSLCPLTNAGLRECRHFPIQTLCVRQTELDDSSIPVLADLRVGMLLIGETNISNAGAAKLRGQSKIDVRLD